MRNVNMYTAKVYAGVSARLTAAADSVVLILIEEIAEEQFP